MVSGFCSGNKVEGYQPAYQQFPFTQMSGLKERLLSLTKTSILALAKSASLNCSPSINKEALVAFICEKLPGLQIPEGTREKKKNSGVDYETSIHGNVVASADPELFKVGKQDEGGIDVPLKRKDGVIGNIEVKKAITDTMGGTSFRVSSDGILSEETKTAFQGYAGSRPIIQDNIGVHLASYLATANGYITQHNSETGTNYPLQDGFPLKEIPNIIRRRMVSEGHQKKIQSFYESNIEEWKKFYQGKGVSYIQIGDMGFYYLIDNPLSLPVPQLTGTISLEVRLLAAGSNGKAHTNVDCALKFKRLSCKKSPYNLNNLEDCKKLFGSLAIAQESAQPSLQ